MRGPTKDNARGQAGEVGKTEERQPKDSTQDPLFGWFALGAHARQAKQKRRPRRKAVRK